VIIEKVDYTNLFTILKNIRLRPSSTACPHVALSGLCQSVYVHSFIHSKGAPWNSKCSLSARYFIRAILKRCYSFIQFDEKFDAVEGYTVQTG
jgi:hypothetical protein